jgi:hypothetical protein
MVLNQLRTEDADPDRIIRLSFHQYQHDATVPPLEEELAEITATLRASESLDTDQREVGRSEVGPPALRGAARALTCGGAPCVRYDRAAGDALRRGAGSARHSVQVAARLGDARRVHAAAHAGRRRPAPCRNGKAFAASYYNCSPF